MRTIARFLWLIFFTLAAQADVWIGTDRMLYRLDPASGQVPVSVATDDPVAIAIDPSDQSLWVLTDSRLQKRARDGTLSIDLSLFTIEASGARHLAVDPTDGSVWVGEGNRFGLPLFKQLVHVSRTGAVLGSWSSPGSMGGLAVAPDHSLWILADKFLFRDRLYHLSPAGAVLAEVDLRPITSGEPRLLRVDNIGAWIWVGANNQVVRIDADQLSAPPLTVPLATSPDSLTTDELTGRIWVRANSNAYRFSESGVNERSVSLGSLSLLGAIEFDPSSRTLWVTHRDGTTRFNVDGLNPLLYATPRRTIVIAVTPLVLQPTVVIESPSAGALLNNARPTIILLLGASCTGSPCSPGASYVSGLTIQALLNGQQVGSSFAIDANAGTASYVPPAALPEGPQSLQVTVTDSGGRVSPSASVSFAIDTVAPTFVTLSPDSPKLTNQTPIQISGRLSESASLKIGATTVPVATDLTFSHAYALSEGGNTAVIEARDTAENTTTRSLAITLDTVPPPAPVPASIAVAPPQASQSTVVGNTGSTEPNARVRITNLRTGETIEVVASAAGGFTATISAQGGDQLTVVVVDSAGNQSAPSMVAVPNPQGGIPPDPATVAPPIDRTVTSTLADTTAFLYEGSNPIQTGVAAGAIKRERAAVVRGRVLDRSGTPLPGVKVSLLGQPDFGQTLSRADGAFDFALNGGGIQTFKYEKTGFLPAHRQANTTWQQFHRVEDTVLVALDARVTAIGLGSGTMQAAQGNEVTDSSGSRKATVLFPAGLTAELVMPGGATQAISNLSVRATEYTVGPNGPKAMPAELPATSGYTYAVELSVDEAMAVGAKEVRFSGVVPVYVENFLNFPVGGAVPAGWYDREKAVWIASANGRVVKLLSIQSGSAQLDTDGDGAADDAVKLGALGVSPAEQAQLATLFGPGQTLWRVPIRHFTPWDMNWPFGPPDGAVGPTNEPPKPDPKKHKPDCQTGSIIECQNQTLGERIPIAGTPFSLNYRSDRVPARKSQRVRIPLTKATIPAPLKRVELQVFVAGKVHNFTFAPAPNLTHDFEWDGRDVYGRLTSGEQFASVTIGFVYDATYREPGNFAQSFAVPGGGAFAGNFARQEITISQYVSFTMSHAGGWDAREIGLGGWTISAHHTYDVNGRTLHQGDGLRRFAENSNGVIDTVAGANGFAPGNPVEGGPAVGVSWANITSVAIAPDGSFYVSGGCSGGNYIRRVGTNGLITTIATDNNNPGFGGDGGPALAARIWCPYGLALDADGAVMFSDSLNHRIRKISRDGIISTIAGNGTQGYGGDGGPALQASLNLPRQVVAARDGSLYIVDVQNHRIRRVGTDGMITTVAGSGSPFYSGPNPPLGDGGLAINAALNGPRSVAFDLNGNMYITDSANSVVRKVAPSGQISTFAFNGEPFYGGDGGPALQAGTSNAQGVVVDREGNVIVFADGRLRQISPTGTVKAIAGGSFFVTPAFQGDGAPATQSSLLMSGTHPGTLAIDARGRPFYAEVNRIRRLSYEMPGFSNNDVAVSSAAGRAVYRFSPAGRHLSTVDAKTGALLMEFGYQDGKLASIRDGDGNVTTIARSAGSITITGPHGHVTTLGLDSNGWASSVANAAGDTHTFAMSADGLMQQFTNPRTFSSTFQWESDGLLKKASDAGNGFWNFDRVDVGNKRTIAMTTAEGRVSSHEIEDVGTGDQLRTTTLPDGTKSTRRFDANGSTIETYSDGAVVTAQLSPDPRFGMNSPFVRHLSASLPSGLSATVSATLVATLATPGNPLSLAQETATVTVNGRVFRSVYDGALGEFTRTSAENRISTIRRDTQGRTTFAARANIDPISIEYDTRGRVKALSQGAGPESRSLTVTYGTDGFVETVTDAEARGVLYSRDAVGRVRNATLPGGTILALGQDRNGNVTGITPPGRPLHAFGFSAVDLPNLYSPPTAGLPASSTQYSYNRDRQLTDLLLPDGRSTTYGYSTTSGRLSTVTPSANGGNQIQLTYHPTTSQVTTVSAGGISLGYTYDGFLLKQETFAGPVPGTVSRNYDTSFRTTQVVVNGTATTFGYDRDGLLTQAGSMTLGRRADNGFLASTTLGAVSTTHTFNTFGEPATFTASSSGTSRYSYANTYDRIGRVKTRTEIIEGVSTSIEYGYDLPGRIETVKHGGVQVRKFGYDANGNRTHLNDVLIGTYDDQDRMIAYQGRTYVYGANGELQLKTDGASITQYRYDVFGNLQSATLPNGTLVEYLVDGRNRRVGKRVNGILRQGFLYQDQLRIAAELDGAGATVSRFVHGTRPNLPEYMIKGGVTYRLIADQVGSVRLVVDISSGTIAQRIDYDEFGNVLADSNPGFQPFGFAGGLFDGESGLVRFGARDYDPQTGRWTAKDPIRFAGRSTNLYQYAGGDPIGRVDPSGLVPLGECAINVLELYFDREHLKSLEFNINGPVPPGKAAFTPNEREINIREDSFSQDTARGLGLIAHEIVHTLQHRDNMFFALEYLAELARRGDELDNKFEKPAYELQFQVQRDLKDLFPKGIQCNCSAR